jgi:CRISPR-associated protein Cas4
MGCKEITLAYLSFLSRIIDEIFGYNREYLKRFIIPLQELRENIISGMNEEIILRASSVFDAQNRGFLGSQIFENLEPKYFSEFKIESETLGLKGKVDRVMITKESIIPFELKTRPVERIYESDEIQLTAYSMLLEEFFHKQVPTGIIESGNKKQEILIRKEMREKVISLIEEINNLQSPKFPVNFSKCNSCQLKPDCDSISV